VRTRKEVGSRVLASFTLINAISFTIIPFVVDYYTRTVKRTLNVKSFNSSNLAPFIKAINELVDKTRKLENENGEL
jgi:hypothetical protein